MTGTEEASSGRSTAGMHAFLFADLRGYTQFAATRGDRAAAELLERYRLLVREQVARHAGAEVRTEGDSFYVVFPSVSAAVRCALAIAAAAQEASTVEPSLPLNVGIGVHFGETIDTAEGSVGSAVNLAARLASSAGPNEVLVSDVVRSLLRGEVEVRTIAAGTRRLKGFAEPVAVYRASQAGSPQPVRRPRPLAVPAFLGGAAAVVALIVALSWVAAGGLERPTTAPTVSLATATDAPEPSTPGEQPFVTGHMDPGVYVDRTFVPKVRLEFYDAWCGGLPTIRGGFDTKPGSDLLYLFSPGEDNPTEAIYGDPCASTQGEPDAGFVTLNRVDQVYGPTACDDGVTRSVGRSWDELVDYLTTRPGTAVTNRSSAHLGGVVGIVFDLHVDEGTVCLQSGAPTRAVLAFPMTIVDRASGKPRIAAVWWGEGQYLRLWVVDLDGQLVVATLGHENSTEPISREFSDKAYRMIQGLRFLSN